MPQVAPQGSHALWPSLTGLDEFSIVGRLHKLWSWADANLVDGNAASVTFSWLDRYVVRDGFCAALAEIGWLEETDDGVRFPGWEKHMGTSAKKRAQTAERQSRARERDRSVTQVVTQGALRNALPEEEEEEEIHSRALSQVEMKLTPQERGALQKWLAYLPSQCQVPNGIALNEQLLAIRSAGKWDELEQIVSACIREMSASE